MNLRTKLMIAFGIVASIPLVGGTLGFYAHRDASLRAREISVAGRAARDGVDATRRAQATFKLQVQEWKNVLLRGHNQPAYDKHVAGFEKAEHLVQQALENAVAVAPALDIDVAEIHAARKAHANLGQDYRTALREFVVGDPASSAKVDRLVTGVDRAPTEALDTLANHFLRQGEDHLAKAVHHLETRGTILQWVIVVGSIIGAALGATFGWWTSNAVTRHIGQTAGRMWDRTTAVAAAAQQVSGSSQSVAETSSQQAASLEESSASLTEVSAAVKQNAEHTREAREVAKTNRSAADGSATEIAQLQVAMQEVTTASGNIAKIVRSIDEIAFQTNILALNAAVEAARAGEAGAGFAVVAEEVRSLAQRSAEAARETAGKIEDATNKSTRGAELANRVGQSLQRVIEGTHKVDELIGQIAEASGEQARGLEQAVGSMHRIDQLTQSNTAAATETAKAARQLDTDAGELRHELSQLVDTQKRTTEANPQAAPHARTAAVPLAA